MLWFLLLCVCAPINSLNILGIFPHAGKSHVDVFLPLMKSLAVKGHNVTVMSHYPLPKPLPRYTDVNLIGDVGQLTEVINLKEIWNNRIANYLTPYELYKMANLSCESGLNLKTTKNLMRNGGPFDVIIIELFNSDCFMAFALKFKAPIIGISSSTIMPWTSQRFGNPTHPAYIPNNLMDYSDKMTFWERMENSVLAIVHQIYFDYVMNNNDKKLVIKHFGKQIGNLKDAVQNCSLLLVNSHFTLNLPRPWVPNIIEVGGIHISGPAKSLPKNIEKWINESSEGVIYFSMGSMIKGHTFPADKRNEFLKAFGRLPQRVLWKWENETMEGKPNNVMIQKWMPQFDILCHPNVKAFISHGGLLGTTEAVHCGVPVIVMPQFGDQYTNARALEATGGGVILKLTEATEDKIYAALKKVLSPQFRRKAKELSDRFRDRPLPPLETAIYWVEYVARHKGAPHMRTAAVDMPFYKYHLLDVISFLVLLLSFALYSFYFIGRLILRRLLASNAKVKTH